MKGALTGFIRTGGGVLAPNSDIGPSAYHLIDLEADIAFRHLRVVGGGVECPRRSVAIRTVLSSNLAKVRLDRLTIRDAEVPRFVATDQSGYKQGRTVFGVAQDQIQVLQTRQALVESAKAVIQRSAVKERVQINRMTKAQKVLGVRKDRREPRLRPWPARNDAGSGNPDFHFSFGSANHRVASDAFIYEGWKVLKALRRSTPNG